MVSLLLLPGLACDEELFRDQLPALQMHYRVRVSDVHTRCDGIPEMAATLLAEQPGAHVLVGCSMGGMLAFEMLRQAQQRVLAVGVLGSSARPDTPELIALRTQACEVFASGRMDELLRANVLFAFHRDCTQMATLVPRYLAMMRRAGAQQLIRQNRAVMARVDSRPLLPTITCPVLVACGNGDLLTPLALSQEMAAAIPHARLEAIAGAGHMLTMEQPAAVAAVLLDWLASLGL